MRLQYIWLSLVVVLLAACGTTAPAETYDGLVRQDSSAKFDELYVRPGATFDGYSAYGLESCEVAFRKNWLRDQNTNRVDLSNRVTQKDVDRIRDSIGGQCDRYLREALQKAPAYSLVEAFSNGESVLILRPKIINLNINAPDIVNPGISRSFTTSFGEMTLTLEILDGTTGEILARIVDRRRGMEKGYLQWTNGVTNKADSDRILRRWADQLRRGLDRAITGTVTN
jgi:hypothetical protein